MMTDADQTQVQRPDETPPPSGSTPAAGSTGRRLTLAVTFLTGVPLKVEGT
jgi:hypothetical protein